jgi:hypothetical protein
MNRGSFWKLRSYGTLVQLLLVSKSFKGHGQRSYDDSLDSNSSLTLNPSPFPWLIFRRVLLFPCQSFWPNPLFYSLILLFYSPVLLFSYHPTLLSYSLFEICFAYKDVLVIRIDS